MRILHTTSSRALAALLLVAAVAACGGDDDPVPAAESEPAPADATIPVTTPATTAPALASSAGDVFPVMIEHVFGETVIPAEPERVVVAGLNEADYLYSLGVAPVGVHEWWGGYPYATGPWADATRIEVGAEPAVQDGFDVNVEWVAAQDPDLIVVAYHDIDQNTYDLLSEIAPVVAHPAGHDVELWSAPWRVQYRLIADAVGRRDRAEEVIAEVDAQIAQIKADYPQFEGATFDTGALDGEGGIATYSSGDLANQLIAELGLRVPEEFDALAEGVYITIPGEQLELMDKLDVFIWLDEVGGMPAEAAKLPLFATSRLHTEGREVVPSRDEVMAIAFNTPLSIPYYLQQLAPQLAAALDGDPSTT